MEKNKNRFPIQPRVFAFIHFFHSNNIPIEGNDWKGKLQFLFARGIREFERILGPQEPKILNLGFDPRKAAVEILKDCGMPEDEIFVKKRHYFIVPPRSTRLKYTPPVGRQVFGPTKYEGRGLDEFLMKAETNDQTPKNWIYCDGRFIDPKAELQKKKEVFEKNLAERLAHDPWVQERAQLSLKNRGMKITFQDFEEEVNQIATKDKNEMMDHKTWLDKVKNYVYLIPVIGSGELIVEGFKKENGGKFC